MKTNSKAHFLLKVSQYLIGISVLSSAMVFAGGGKLLATAGLTQVEGAGGGGLVPWATLSGYDTQDQISVGAFNTQVNLDDFRLQSAGVNASFYDRVELSLAQQTFDLRPSSGDIRQNIIGIKARLYGDVVYSVWPQVSLGVQHKRLIDQNTGLSPTIAATVGAEDSDHGTDIYLAMTKVHLGLLCGYNVVWNLNFRATKANQIGLLGFGGDKNNRYELMTEASAGILLNEYVAVGLEYRQKPDNLSFSKEDDWKDVFIAYIPNKNISATLAWAELGTLAGATDQNGWYLSLNANL